MPEISQKTLDALIRKVEKKDDKATIVREMMAGFLIPELKPILRELSNNVKELKNLKITTPPIEMQEVKANVVANVPDVIVPEIKIPDVKIPDIKVEVPEIKIPKIKAPSVTVKVPEIKIPEIKIPAIKVPEIKTDRLVKAIVDAITGLKIKAPSVNVSGGSRGVRPATQATSINLAMATSGTEYSAKIPDSTKNFTVKLRSTSATLLVSYSDGGTADSFTTLTRGQTYTSPDGMDLNGVIIYLQANANTQVAEITCWT